VPYTFCKKIPYTVCKQVPYTVCKQVPYTVCTKVPFTVTECVPTTVCKKIKVRTCEDVCVSKARRVPVTVCEDVCPHESLLSRLFKKHLGCSAPCEGGCSTGREDDLPARSRFYWHVIAEGAYNFGMRNLIFVRCASFTAFLAATLVAQGCDGGGQEREAAKAETTAAGPKKVKVGDNVVLEIDGDKRRVLLNARVCLREGQLEQLLCRKNTKEHEAILSADLDARDIHQALLLAKAEAGSPVKYAPKFRAPRGTTIKITLQYEDKGKLVSASARSWIMDQKTKKELASDWVFAGSQLVENSLEKDKKFYLANEGDVICVSNFEGAMLDLPIKSDKDWSNAHYQAFTEHIPPVDTKVVVILEPVLEAPKGK
jgi:hypothetical protein